YRRSSDDPLRSEESSLGFGCHLAGSIRESAGRSSRTRWKLLRKASIEAGAAGVCAHRRVRLQDRRISCWPRRGDTCVALFRKRRKGETSLAPTKPSQAQ